MTVYKADLHIHTVLSPCGDLEMSPNNIITKAKERGIDIIGITDHNSTLHGPLVKEIGQKNGIYVMMGVEITTKEEVHCLAFFENNFYLSEFQKYLEDSLPNVLNDIELFGYQVVVDDEENILMHIDKLLISALNKSIEEVEKKVHNLKGIFIPAHIDKNKNSIISQLGFIPLGLQYDALEFSKYVKKDDFFKKNDSLREALFISSSDAHYIDDVGSVFTEINCEVLNFNGIKEWLNRI